MKIRKNIKELPKISIVTPSFNHVEFIENTFCSVLGQHYPKLEYVVVDGGSKDGSVDIIKSFEKKIHWWVSERDNGQYHAINKGFSKTTGEIMGWINSDDFLLPTTLHLVAEIFNQCPDVDWITSLLPSFASSKGVLHTAVSLPGYSRQAFLDGRLGPPSPDQLGWIQQESTFWRRSLWEKCGSAIPLEYSFAADFHLWSLFFEHAQLYGVHAPLGVSRSILGQRSKQGENYKTEMIDILETARYRASWKPSKAKKLKLFKRIPLIRNMLKEKFGYTASIVQLSNPSTGGTWEIKYNKFW